MPFTPAPAELESAIRTLKKELNAVILAHYYQESDIQDVADFIGDSLALAQEAARTEAKVIVFCGVHFMAETAKILNPSRLVLLPDLKAGCSLADRTPPAAFAAFKAKHPGAFVVTYVNSSAEVKAMSDVICTSSNAVKMVEKAPKDRPIIFAPDQHLGRWVQKQTGRELILWPGSCIVHEIFSEKLLVQLKVQHPEAEVVAHPECQERVLAARRLHRLHQGHPRARAEEPEARVHRGHRGGHPPPDGDPGPGEDLHPGASRTTAAAATSART